MARKNKYADDSGDIEFEQIPKSTLFTDPIPQPQPQVQQPMYQPQPAYQQQVYHQAYQQHHVSHNPPNTIDPVLLLLLSMFNNQNNNQQQMPNYYPPVIETSTGGCNGCYPNLQSDILEIKMKLEELKHMEMYRPVPQIQNPMPVVMPQQAPVQSNSSNGSSEEWYGWLYDLITQNHDESWNKLLDIEAKVLELQNEHYDIYNLVNSKGGSGDYYPPAGNDEYYEETTTTTSDDGYDDGYYEDDGYSDEYSDYYINKKNYKEFMKLLKEDVRNNK